jgi:hypothetical protein
MAGRVACGRAIITPQNAAYQSERLIAGAFAVGSQLTNQASGP